MQPKLEAFLPAPRRVFWRSLQALFFSIGAVILVALFAAQELGLHLLWNVLIPVAPALLVLAPGLWRNVCPMGTASLIPYHARLSRRKRIGVRWQGQLFALAVALLIVIVPLRHVALDINGLITGVVLLAVAVAAGSAGFIFDAKSFWCSGLCPVYPVEMLYGGKPAATVRNSHCRDCTVCVAPCADSHQQMLPSDAARTGPGRWAGLVLVGGFPGFIIGWYQVPAWPTVTEGLRNLHVAYAWPLGGLVISLVVFAVLANAYPKALRGLTLLFAAASVGAYYWFKLPVMLGLGDPGSAIIPGLSFLPVWAIWPMRFGAIAVFAVLLLRPTRKAWTLRPPRLHKAASTHA
jgi:hypothetical protein